MEAIYYDTEDKALREKIDGVNMREKFRIRMYNRDPSLIRLEKKSKRNGLGIKFSANLSVEETEKIIEDEMFFEFISDIVKFFKHFVETIYIFLRSIFLVTILTTIDLQECPI